MGEKKHMKKIKDIFKDTNLYLFAIITFCFFGAFARIQFAPDTYSVFSNSARTIVTHFFACGRFITGVSAGVCLKVLNLSDNCIYILSYGFAVICTIISLYKLFNLINKDTKNKVLSMVLSILVIINIFSFELFVYIEKGIMMFSVLMCILAVEQVDKFFENKKWKHLAEAMLWMIIATCSYQGTVGIFVAVSLIYIIKYSKTIKEFLLNNIIVASIYGIPAIINFLLVRFTSNNNRVEGNIIILESIQKIIEGTKTLLINTYNFFPKYLFFICILGILIFVIYKAIKSKEEKEVKGKLLKIAGAMYIIAGTLFATVAPQILQNTDSIWFVARSSYPMASVIGILLIYLFNNFKVNNTEKKIIICFSCIFMLIQIIYFTTFTIDGYTVNYIDKQQAMEIIKQISEYEEQTGKQITSIAFYKDKSTVYVHSGINASGDINVRAFSTDWIAISILKYYSGIQFQTVEGSELLQEKFKEKDWQEFSEEQIILENDTIHLCLY